LKKNEGFKNEVIDILDGTWPDPDDAKKLGNPCSRDFRKHAIRTLIDEGNNCSGTLWCKERIL
jgi:hypothetical protein